MDDMDGLTTAAHLASGDMTVREVVEAAIERCEARNPALNAVIHDAFDRSLDRADAIRPGSTPLAGVPILTKDLLCREAGLPFHEGSAFLKSIGWTGPDDQVNAVRLREAGMVSIGRTNCSEFGMQTSTEPLAYGPTHNPWKPGHSPGGSSGGSAAAVAAGIVPIATGNDVGGSIRNPASMCGLVGLKPSRGRSNLGPDFGDVMLGMAEEHVITRTVRDSAAALDVLARSGPTDPYHQPMPGAGWLAAIDAPVEPMKIGFLVPPEADEPVAAATRAVAEALDARGHDVSEDGPPALGEDIRSFLLPNYSAGTAWVVDRHWPTLTGVDAIPEDLLEPTTAFLAARGRALSAADLLEAREHGQHWSRRLLAWWADGGYDLLVLPTLPVPPPAHGETDDLQMLSYVAPFNYSGQPAASVPAAMHDGLPIGVQLVAPLYREDLIFAAALQLESDLPRPEAPPAPA